MTTPTTRTPMTNAVSQLTPSARTAWYLLEQYINGEDTPYAYYAPMTFPLPEPGEVTLALKDGWGIGRGELVELERAGLIRLTSGVKFRLAEYGKQAIEGR